MTPEKFSQLAKLGYNRIPIKREVLADLDTPVSAYLKLTQDKAYSYLLESVQGGEKWGRYSIIGLPANTIVQVYNHQVKVYKDGSIIEDTHTPDPLQWIEEFKQSFRVPKLAELPTFNGGLVGYFAYDTVRYTEQRLAKTSLTDPLNTPDILLMLSDELVIFDNLKGKLYLIVHADPNQENALSTAEQNLDALVARLRDTLTFQSTKTSTINETDFKSEFKREQFEQAVIRAKEYIVQGDIMQVVLSQRLSIDCELPPLDIYRALRCINPSPYMYYLNLDDFHIVGSSPEILVRLEEQKLTVRPIAGTRPRGANEEQDLALEKDLLADPKECAEHLMLIDLGRNDVGRVSEIGSVELTENMGIERYSHVMHIVSNVIGHLKPSLTTIDVLKATLPAGTLSGAPKIRAMEIIDELEPIKRGIYGGAIGYLSWHSDMDTAIAIRTAIIKDNKLYIQAGAGIVADSVPATEWEESMNKGRAIFKAVAMAAAGFTQKEI
ncbi:anthranilate synthase component I [Candidatus Marithrix sp. Canyon 246]|uniref:anthranilate synthase component I n=1 Tax=Candidatus Marithrix sp. Canyon 246 TaxID=1827136 RepID=UPI000849F6FA|nr:anthranilate synthase component I [Candidatus Marithrix sp. Canyon 246]